MTPETLVRDPEAPEAAPEHADGAPAEPAGPADAAVAVERACPSCGAALAPDQEWCLECGTAAAGRSGGLPGWRTAAATIAVCLTLASGAVAAAYAAINSDDTVPPRTTIAQAPVDEGTDLGAAPALDTPASTPAAPAADASAEAPPPADPPAASAPASTPAPAAAPAPAATPTPTPSSGGGTTTDEGTDTPGSSKGGDDQQQDGDDVPGDRPAEPPVQHEPLVPVDLAGVTATTYDPAAHAPETFTDPAAAIDGDPATSWTATLTPEQIAQPNVGLSLDLGEAIGVRRLVLTPTSPGTTVEVYGTTKATPPASADDPAWTSLATQLDVQGKTKIPLGDGSDKVRHLLVVFADGPVDGSTSVGISELALSE
ncbi:MAG TPA: hypothetical protein VFR97_00270 [Capillimicrobium sp.]|nr:hypothetical protein [Capillimicrobium sp.]